MAVIGATDRAGSVGNTVPRNLLRGYQGRVNAVNPDRKEILGLSCFTSIRTVPEVIDLAVIVIPVSAVPEIVAECRKRKTAHARFFSPYGMTRVTRFCDGPPT